MTVPPTFQADTNQRNVVISLNPNAGAKEGGPLAQKLVEHLAEANIAAVVSSDLKEVSRLSEQWRSEGSLRAVVAGGGDGTVGLLTNTLPKGTPISILPLGTENLLAKHLGIKPSPAQVAQIIIDGQGVRMDAGEADGRLFLLMLGVGFDADVVHRLHEVRRGHIHHLSYAKPIFESICNYQYPELRVYRDGQASPVEAKWAFVVNLPRYAGGLSFSPGANEFDGRMDVCTFRQGSLWHGLRYLSGVVFQQHQNWDDVQIQPASVIRIESNGEAHYQLDGDPGGFLPVEIRVLPDRLSLMTPVEWPQKRQAELDSGECDSA